MRSTHIGDPVPEPGQEDSIALHLIKQLFAILILVAGLVITPLAEAGDLIVSRATLEDKAGNLTITDVAGLQFTPIGPTLSKGYTNSVHWLRIQVKKPAAGDELVLFIRQPFLNDVRLYEADSGNPSGWKTRVTGNRYPYKERERSRNTLGFVVRTATPEATYYLRLKTSSVAQLSVEALTPVEADRRDSQFDLLEVFFVTAMVLLLLWAIHSYLLDRLLIVGLFAIHQGVYTLFGVGVTGYLAPYLPDGFPLLADLSTAIPYCGVSFTTLLFCRELFKSYEPPALLMRGLNLFLLVFPLQLVAMALGYTSLAVIVNAILIKFTWWYFVIITFTLRREQSPSRRMLQAFFVAITLVFTLFWVTGSIPAVTNNSLIGRQILIVNGIMIGGIFAMILNARSRRLLQEAQQSAKELKAKSEFLALVSHEIRTPLNALVGFSTLARTATDRVKLDQYLTILEKSSQSLMELVNSILDMSKMEAGQMELEAVPFNLRQLVTGLQEQYGHLAAHKKLAFNVIVAADVPTWVLCDPVRLRQILANLLANSVKFTDSGEVSCSVSLVNRPTDKDLLRIRFEVRDTGIGIPESGIDQLFQPFRQLDPSITRTFGGTGLGLAIVHSLTTLMKGSITVDSREGVGSCFVIELPLQESEAAPDDQFALPAALKPAAVLVVEDNGFNRRLLGEILTTWGHRVTLAEDGWQALQLMERQTFDLVLLDIRMPEIDGIEVARRIRRREQEQSSVAVPIIAITADGDAATREGCLNAGINAILAKPIIPEQLARIMTEHCGRAIAASISKELLLSVQTSNDLGNNPERARKFREMLLQDIGEELQCLQSALECDNRSELGRAAHTLKGLCGHLSKPEPAELAALLQHKAASSRPEELRTIIEQMRSIFQSGHDTEQMGTSHE